MPFNFFFRKPTRPDELARTMHRRWWLDECWMSVPLPTSDSLRRTHRRIREALKDARNRWENNENPNIDAELLKRIEYLESFKLDQWVIVDD